ncbi:PilZ domain-containing protein [Novosphingobium sp. PhB165]|uniref:PilZ domain-containing protein n=1 Tax=Novosphingobium sp. PhB165 TaxID=2485105 RepID=UPI00104F83E7|nr:PilZ domain-containing protein [Novosphingobium sp. PhB165]TCM18659.1 PilZ domain-containing protein [Novosphingobium sp. PhB165]
MTYPDRVPPGAEAAIEPSPAPTGRSPDQRDQPRFALLLRQAKLVGNGREYLCIVRDVSESGVKLKLFHDLPVADDYALEITTGERFPMEQVWEEGGEAGFRFVGPVDLIRFIAEAGPFPKRPVRLRVDHPAVIAFAGQDYPATIRDLSRQGAGIETDQMLAIGQKLRLSASELPGFDATVCWRRHPDYGLVFTQLMSLEQLALRTSRMQAAAPED